MSRAEATRAVAVLLAAYPHARIMAQTSSVYEESLMDLDYEHVDRAVRALILTEKDFIPTIAKIRARAVEYRDGQKPEAGNVWEQVRKAVGRYGREREPEALASMDPIAARAMASLGWRDFCQSDMADLPSWRARFIELYNQLAQRHEHERKLAGVLPGPAERRALAERHALPAAASSLVSDLSRALAPATPPDRNDAWDEYTQPDGSYPKRKG